MIYATIFDSNPGVIVVWFIKGKTEIFEDEKFNNKVPSSVSNPLLLLFFFFFAVTFYIS